MSPVYKLSANSVRNGRTVYGSMLAGNTTYVPAAFESIATVTVGSGGAADVEFTSIPGTYKHLQIRYIARATTASGAAAYNWGYLRVNGNSANYATHYLFGEGSSVSAGAETGNQFNYMYTTSNNATSNTFAVAVIDILDYANTDKNKTFRYLGGWDVNGAGGYSMYQSGLWANTSAITSIKFQGLQSSGNFAQYSHFALYGIKEA